MFTLWWWLNTPRGEEFAVRLGEAILRGFNRVNAKGD